MSTEPGPCFAIDVVGQRDRRVLVVAGDLDLAAAGPLQRCIEAVRRPDRPLVLDMAGVTTIDSKGLSVLVKAHRDLIEDGETTDGIVLRAPSAAVRRVLSVTDAGPLFTIQPG